MSIKLLVADDQEVARLGVRGLVKETDVEVVGEAVTTGDLVELVSSREPDVILVSLRLPPRGGLLALEQIKQDHPDVPVVILAEQDYPSHLARAHRSGAAGLLLKDVGREDLLRGLQAVASGESLWTRTHRRRVVGVLATPVSGAQIDVPLTPREGEVLRRMTMGLTNIKIADELGISCETIKEHVQHLLRKIGVADRTQAAIWAVRAGIV